MGDQSNAAVSSRLILSEVSKLKGSINKSKFQNNLFKQIKNNLDLPDTAKDVDILKVLNK